MDINIEYVKARIHIMNKKVNSNMVIIKSKIEKIKSNGGLRKALIDYTEKCEDQSN